MLLETNKAMTATFFCKISLLNFRLALSVGFKGDLKKIIILSKNS
jgi:hypothetical protein